MRYNPINLILMLLIVPSIAGSINILNDYQSCHLIPHAEHIPDISANENTITFPTPSSNTFVRYHLPITLDCGDHKITQDMIIQSQHTRFDITLMHPNPYASHQLYIIGPEHSNANGTIHLKVIEQCIFGH